jgi:ribonuclease III
MPEERMTGLEQLQRGLPYLFRNASLLDTALTHRSYVNENTCKSRSDNERLEFLGDAVLELGVSDLLMKNFPDYQEGQLSQMRAAIVNEQTLAEMAQAFRLGECLLLANAFEALIAAIYLDGGFEEAAALIQRLFLPLLAEERRTCRDYKTTLQQISQHAFKETPRYTLIREYGPDHDKTFEIQLSLADRIQTSGTGKNKKEAEQRAAESAISILDTLLHNGGEEPCR